MVFILFIPSIVSTFRSKLPDLFTNKYDKEATTKSIEFSLSISRIMLSTDIYHINIKGLSVNDLESLLEKQIRSFKDIMIDNSHSYLETEKVYEILDLVFQNITILVTKTPSTVYGLEDLMIRARREWRKTKDWIDSRWRSSSENLLLEIEDLEDKQAELILIYMRHAFDVLQKEIEELKKKDTIKLSFNNLEKLFVERNVKMGKEETNAILTKDQVNNKAKIIFKSEVSIIDKRTAERQATSICRTGFLMHDGRRVGIGCSLEEVDEYNAKQAQTEY